MLKFMHKYGLLVFLAIAGLIIAVFFAMASGIEEFDMERPDVDFIINGSFFLLILGLTVAILLPVFGAIKNPSILIKAGIGVVAILIFYLIGSGMANEQVLVNLPEDQFTYETVEGGKFSGAILNTTYILLGVAVASVVVGPFLKLIRK